MSGNRYRILLVASHPVQYSTPIFQLMAQHPKLDILVAYCSLQGAEPGLDSGFGIEVSWDVPLLDGYPWVQLHNQSLKSGLDSFFGLNNPELWSLIRREQFDAVILLTGYRYWSFWIALIAAKVNRTAVFFGTDSHELRSRDNKSWKAWLKPWIWSRLFRLADVVILPSSGGIALMRSLGIPEERLVLTPYVVDNSWWSRQAEQVNRSVIRYKWGIPDNAVVILFCAKLQPWKRPHDAMKAFTKAGVEGSYLVFAGEGPLHQDLQKEAETLNITERVRFLGFVNQSQLPSVYCSADLLVFPSEYEPFGVVVNEAMLCGCPVVASDRVGACHDLIQDGETGFIYSCGDVDALAEIFRVFLAAPEHLRQMAVAAIKRMEAWSPHENVEALVKALEKSVPNKLINDCE